MRHALAALVLAFVPAVAVTAVATPAEANPCRIAC